MLGDLLRELLGGGNAKPAMKKSKPMPNRDGGMSSGMRRQLLQRDPMQLTKPGGAGLESLMFANIPRRQYEDEALMNGQQGFSPMTSDIARFRSPRNFNQQRNINTQSIPEGLRFDPMQSAARMQYGAQNQFESGQNPFLNEDYRNRLRVR